MSEAKGIGLKYHIYMEGFRFQKNRYPSEYVGEHEAETFAEACEIAFKGAGSIFNRDNLTVDGRHLFDNEYDAQALYDRGRK